MRKHVEQTGNVGISADTQRQLITGNFRNNYFRPAMLPPMRQTVEQRHADVADRNRPPPGRSQPASRQGRAGALAVGAGNQNQAAIDPALFTLAQIVFGEQMQIPANRTSGRQSEPSRRDA